MAHFSKATKTKVFSDRDAGPGYSNEDKNADITIFIHVVSIKAFVVAKFKFSFTLRQIKNVEQNDSSKIITLNSKFITNRYKC